MDPSSYHHHHHHHHKHHPTNHPRYVPLSPVHPLPPPPQAPPPYQQSPRNLYPSRHHVPSQILPPPPPPPPQQNQQQPYQPLPPPPPLPRQQYSNHPPYNPHHPQYTSDPNFDPKPNPTHVSHQFHDIPPRRLSEFGTHPDYWPENRVSRPHSVSNLDRETHYHQFERRAASPGIDRFMHDLEGTSRFRDLEPNQGEREDRGRALNDRWISDRSSRDFEIVSFGFDSNSNNSRFDHDITENMRRGSRLREQLLDSGNKEINERDEMRVFPRKNDYYDSEAERYNDKGSCREGDHELNRTPRKQIQKKSALLRIQKAKPSHRSREDERSHYLGYHNEGKTGTLRGKDLAIHSEHGMEEKQREGTPVELDVSFKSNSLVAKAIVSPAPNSDTNLRPRNTKIRKVMTFDKGSSSCQPNKGNERSAKLGGSSSAVKTASGPVETKQSEGKIKSSDTGKAQDCSRKPCLKGPDVLLRKGKVKKSPKVTVTEDALISDKTPRPLERKGTIPSIGNMGDGVVQPHSIRVNTAVGGNKGEGTVKSIVSDKTGASAGKPSSLKANKKKIIVRKVVKKVVNSSSNLGKSELAKKGDQLVKTDTSARCVSGTSMAENSVIPLKMKLASAFGDSVHAVDSECSPEKSALILENEKLNEASKDTVLKDVCTDVDPVSSISPNILRKRNSSTLALSSSSHEDGKATVKKKRRISTSNSSLTLPLNSQSFAVSDILKSAVQVPSNFTDLLPLEPEIKVSSTDDLHAQGIDLLHVNSSVVGPSDAVGSFSDACRGDLPRMDPCSAFAKSFAPRSPCLLPLNLEGEQCSTGTPVSAISNHQIDAMDIEGDDTGKVLVDTAEEQHIISSEVAHCRSIPELKFSCSDKMLPGIDVDDDNHLLLKDDLPSTSNSLISGVDANEVSATNSSDEGMPAPDMLCDVGSLSNLVLSASTSEGHLFQNSEEKTCEKLSDDKPVFEGVCNSSAHVSDSQHSKTILKSNDVIMTNKSRAGKAGLLPSHDSVSTISLNLLSGETQGRKTQLSHVGPKSYPTRSSFVSSSKNATSSTNITKPRTWHRTDNSSAYPLPGNKPSLSANPMQRQMPTYIRKGNSLVRKPITVPSPPQGSHSLSSSVYRLKSGTGIVDEVKKGTGPNNRADAVELRTAGASTSFERPITPPLSSVTKVPKHPLNSSRECISSPLAEPSTSEDYETTRNHQSSMEINDVLKSPENELKTSETLNRTSSINNLEDLNEQNESGLVPLNEKRVTYVKPKSNQLVATSDCDHASILDVDKNQSFSASSDGYYKKRKNQLIRTALESHMKLAVTMSDDISNSVRQIAAKVISGRPFGKRRSNKVLAKARKPSKFSLVWTPHSARLSNDDGNPPCYPKVRPQLFPWKRMAHRRSFRLSSVSSYNGSLSTIGRKMLLLRKRNTVYTRSTNGFSIRKSKVLSVGGSSLKWSKSIEKHSRKANEEATLAVAEAERKKREQNGPVSGTGKKGLSCHKVLQGTVVRRGERIFRIGSVRYKMDSSRRSLQRISDDASSCSASQQSENSTKKSYVPRRLVIGNDEYVRIGNGNQLVRNPKKRTRVLASEKVRWSLHTARLRLVKKRKYCQFFTRFGKCNKDDGKCPYIHDPSKISVCTKFLKGLCSNPNCKLTHKVIPERMPDCSYFLQGLCTNENCPYRHVHVNPKASTCEGFLRGYCADGNECRKKHSYVCPNFEAAGSCPLGPKCKLHHPKNRSKEKKSQRSMEHKGARGRYFGIDISEPKRMVSERQHQVLEDDSGCFHGKFSDYIKLDVSDDDEAGDLHEVICDQTTFVDNESSDMQREDLDELIKPIRLINEYKRRESFLVSESSSVEHLAVQ